MHPMYSTIIICLLYLYCSITQAVKRNEKGSPNVYSTMLSNGSNCYSNQDCASGCCLFLQLRPFSGTCIAQALPGQICGSIIPPLSKAAFHSLQSRSKKSNRIEHSENSGGHYYELVQPSTGHHCSLCNSGCCCGHTCCDIGHCPSPVTTAPQHGGQYAAVSGSPDQHRSGYQPTEPLFSPPISAGHSAATEKYGPTPSAIEATKFGKWCAECFSLCCCKSECCDTEHCVRRITKQQISRQLLNPTNYQNGHQRHYTPATFPIVYHPQGHGNLPATSMMYIKENNGNAPKPYISGYEQLMALLLLAQLQKQQPATIISDLAPMYPEWPLQQFPEHQFLEKGQHVPSEEPPKRTVLANVPNFTLPEAKNSQGEERIDQELWNDYRKKVKNGRIGKRIRPKSVQDVLRFPERVSHVQQHSNSNGEKIIYPETAVLLYPEKDRMYNTNAVDDYTPDPYQQNTVLQPIDFSELPESIRHQIRPFNYKDSPINETPGPGVQVVINKNHNFIDQVVLHSKLARKIKNWTNSSSLK